MLCLYKLYNENPTQDLSSLNDFLLRISVYQFSVLKEKKKIAIIQKYL